MMRSNRRGRAPLLRPALLAATGWAAVVVMAGGCSSTSSSSSAAPATPATSATSAASSPTSAVPNTVMMGKGKAGPVLTDAAGMSLYTFDKDAPGATASSCTGACAARWPALTVTGTPTAGPGVPGQLAAVGSSAAGSQVAWNGKLLYYFSGDHAAGDTNGDGVGGVWHVVAPQQSSSTATTMVVSGY